MYRQFLISRWQWFKWELKQTDGRKWFVILSISFLLLLVGFALLVLAGYYLHANFAHLLPLPDLGHKILPAWQIGLRFLFVVGPVITAILLLLGGLNEPHRLPYFFFLISFWLVIRTASMTVTPFGPPVDMLREFPPKFSVQNIWDFLRVGLFSPNVLFFSGHTGLPFLGCLMFRKRTTCGFLMIPLAVATVFYLAAVNSYSFAVAAALSAFWSLLILAWKKPISLSAFFLIWSFVMAATVLLTREHYSIDVLGAYFMTAGVMLIGRWLFAKIELFCDKLDKTFETEN